GATVASAIPFPGDCPDAQYATVRPPGCDAQGATVGAMDWNLRSNDSKYVFLGQVDGSVVHGGPAVTTLRDGTLLRPNDAGYGGYMRVAKLSGEPLQWNARYDYGSPLLELNKTG